MLQRVQFASSYVYSPRGAGAVSLRSQLLCRALKAADSRYVGRFASRVRQLLEAHRTLRDVLGALAVLVPVPGRRPRGASLSPVDHLTLALLEQGVGRAAWYGLRRVSAVPKSATAPLCARPSVMHHYESFAVDTGGEPPVSLVLVDDVVTKGRTLLAAAWRLHDAFPQAQINAFALVRTLGRAPEVERLLAPCRGEIRWLHGDAYRWP